MADPGGAAFYGPKISVQARDAIGRTWQVSTIQLDFNLPERFQLEYIAKDGTHQRPVMIHRALFGSIERFFAVLLEHYAGAFPAWLAPVQVLGVPVADEFAPHLAGFVKSLEDEMVRCEIDYSDDRFGKKIRNASKSKVPFILIVGEEDMNNNAVSFASAMAASSTACRWTRRARRFSPSSRSARRSTPRTTSPPHWHKVTHGPSRPLKTPSATVSLPTGVFP